MVVYTRSSLFEHKVWLTTLRMLEARRSVCWKLLLVRVSEEGVDLCVHTCASRLVGVRVQADKYHRGRCGG